MRILAAAVVAVFAAQASPAQKRENRPFNTVNGRAVSGRSVVSAGAGWAGPAGIAANPPLNSGGHAFIGDGRAFTPSRHSAARAVPRGGKAFWSSVRRAGGAAENPPPNFNKPGALIRTAGQAPKYGNPEPERQHTIYAGEIVINEHKARDVGRAPNLQQGPKDTLPPPTPISGAAAGGGAAPNSTTVINNGGNSNSGANNNTNGNQGGNTGSNKDPFADPTGFNDAF